MVEYLRFIYLALLVLALVGGLLRFHRLPLALRYLVGAVAWSLAIEAAAATLRLHHQPNLLLIPLDVVGELMLLALMYRAALNLPGLTRWLPVVVVVFAAYALFSVAVTSTTVKFWTDLQVTEICLLLALAGLYFRQLLSQLTVRHLERDPLFWVSAGLFIYCLGRLQIALFSEYLLHRYSKQLNIIVVAIHQLLLIVLHTSYALALWMRPRK